VQSPNVASGAFQRQKSGTPSFSIPGSNTFTPPVMPSSGSSVLVAERTADALMQECGSVIQEALLSNLPVGPIDTTDTAMLKEVVMASTRNPNNGNGVFSVRLCKKRQPRTPGRKGTRQELCCTERDKCGCQFKLFYEYTTEGWMLYSCDLSHDETHVMPQSTPEAMTSASARHIPSTYNELGHLLSEAGFSAKDIMKVFLVKAQREGVTEPMFNHQDVYNKFVRLSSSARALDACGLVEQLSTRKMKTGLEYFWEPDLDGRIDRIFVECVNGKNVWGTARTSKIIRNVLLFDPTFGSNCYGMKLSMFVTVSSEGDTKIVAYMVHHSEDYEDVFWGMRCFQLVFKHAPATIMTDSAPGIIKAIETMTLADTQWQDTAHLLCVYHMDQNFYTHIHPLFSGSQDGWRTVHNMFWRMAKDSDLSRCSRIDQDMDALKTFVADYGKGSTKPKQLEWIDNVLRVKLDKWAACKTWAFFSAGAHATSRSESTNGAVKAWLQQNSSLLALHSKMDHYEQFKEFKDSCKLQSTLLQQRTKTITYPPFIKACKPVISAYAFKLLLGQFSQVYEYTVEPVPSDDDRSDEKREEAPGTNYLLTRIDRLAGVEEMAMTSKGRTKSHGCHTDCGFRDVCITHWTSADNCSCQYFYSYGMICRHSLAVRLTHPLAPHTDLQRLFHDRWVDPSSYLHDVCAPVDNSSASEGDAGSDEDDPTTCFMDLERTMRINGFKPSRVYVDKFDIREHDGKHIALKYGTRSTGGWHIAKMTWNGNVNEMELYFLFSDKQRAQWLCDINLMVQDPKYYQKHPGRSWLLLEQHTPDTPNAVPRNPPSQRSGRSQTKRKKPKAGGPLS
jgi:hypothetical protein